MHKVLDPYIVKAHRIYILTVFYKRKIKKIVRLPLKETNEKKNEIKRIRIVPFYVNAPLGEQPKINYIFSSVSLMKKETK